MNWYDPSNMPAGQLHVRVWWVGHGTPRQFEAARIFRRSDKQWRWYALVDGQPVELPPRRDRHKWSDAPICWQPLDEYVWSWPGRVPAPLPPHQVPRAVSERQRFSAVDDATDGELAREMERDREDARRGIEVDESTDTYKRWWRDITRIKYESKGEVSREMAEGRVMRAMAWAGAHDLMAPATKVTAQILAAYAAEDIASMVADDTQIIKFRPLPADHSDFEVAMSWVVALNPPEKWGYRRRYWSLSRAQRVLYWLAKNTPLSLAEIADALSCDENGKLKGKPVSWQAIQQTYARAIDQVWQAANGRLRTIDRMEAVRTANRQHRNGVGT